MSYERHRTSNRAEKFCIQDCCSVRISPFWQNPEDNRKISCCDRRFFAPQTIGQPVRLSWLRRSKQKSSIAFQEINEALVLLEAVVDLKLISTAKSELTGILASSRITLEKKLRPKSNIKSQILNIK